VTCYHDWDGDGYPDASDSVTDCECPEGYLLERADGEWDCNDGLARVHPGADFGPGYCPGETDCHEPPCLGMTCPHGVDHDLDCDGVEEQRWTAIAGGCIHIIGVGCTFNGTAGWTGSSPAGCGVLGYWAPGTCDSSCRRTTEVRVQECR